MLTLTDSAVSAIRSLTSQPELPVETGLRIMTQDEGAPSFQLALAEAPVAGDQVIEDGGARVFIGLGPGTSRLTAVITPAPSAVLNLGDRHRAETLGWCLRRT